MIVVSGIPGDEVIDFFLSRLRTLRYPHRFLNQDRLGIDSRIDWGIDAAGRVEGRLHMKSAGASIRRHRDAWSQHVATQADGDQG